MLAIIQELLYTSTREVYNIKAYNLCNPKGILILQSCHLAISVQKLIVHKVKCTFNLGYTHPWGSNQCAAVITIGLPHWKKRRHLVLAPSKPNNLTPWRQTKLNSIPSVSEVCHLLI